MTQTHPAPDVAGCAHTMWRWYLVGGLAAAAAFIALPDSSWGQKALMPAINTMTAIAIVIGVRTHRPQETRLWWMFALSFAFYAAGSSFYFFTEFGFLAPATLVFLGAYLLQVVARVYLVRLRVRGAQPGFWLDTGVILIAGMVVAYVALVRPYRWGDLSDIAEFAASFGWSLVGTFLLILTLMLSLSFGRRPAAYWLLLASMSAQVIGDIAYAYSVIGGGAGVSDFFAGYVIFSTLLGAAALHPSMPLLTENGQRGEGLVSSNPLRIPLLGLALIAPLAMVLAGELMDVDLPVHLIATTGIVLVVLMTIRVSSTMHSLQRADAEKTRFLSRMSHELRTPLSSVLSFAQLLETERLTPDQQEDVEHIVGAGRHLLDLIDDLLDVSRLERGEIAFSTEWLPIKSLLDEVVGLMEPAAASAGITLRGITDDVEGETVWADPVRLKQIALNLVSNAVKYNRPKGLVEVSASVTGDTIVVEVCDTGMGLDEAQIRRLFVAFERLDADSRGIEGTGLGLMLSRRLAEAMGTDIHVRSEPGQGSRFSFELKRGEPSAAPPAAGAAAAPEVAEPARPEGLRRVLLIDDNLPNLRAVEKILSRRKDIDLETAADAGSGIAAARRQPPDLILLDLNLPDMSGLDALSELRSFPSTKDVPVVIVTADAYAERIDELRRAGASDYIKKPFDMATLLQVIDVQLAGEERTIT